MGGFISTFLTNANGCSSSSSKPGLGDLPESCAAMIIERLDPVEICRFAKLNKAFHGASWADFVWESKLPSNYRELFDRVLNDFPDNLHKREIYTRLCRINTFDNNTKKAWLDKKTGGVCLSISSRGLAITGIDDRRYWSNIPTEESRFSAVAYLQQIWWFEVDGEVDFPFPPGTYSVFFRIQLGRAFRRFGRRVCDTEQVHGWDVKPVRFQLWNREGQHTSSQCMLNEAGKWVNCHAGDFTVDGTTGSTKIKFSMTQIDCTHTKGGLCLDSVIVYPSWLKESLKRY